MLLFWDRSDCPLLPNESVKLVFDLSGRLVTFEITQKLVFPKGLAFDRIYYHEFIFSSLARYVYSEKRRFHWEHFAAPKLLFETNFSCILFLVR